MRKTKIVCTIGPASRSEERLEALIRAGMDAARLNFSHGTREEHGEVIRAVRSISARLGHAVALMQDLSGPKIRTGALQGGSEVSLAEGAEITVTTRPVLGNASLIATTYPHLPGDVHTGDRILLADGLMELEVLSTDATSVRCRVVHGGLLGEHKGMNLPGVKLSAPAVTEKDRADLDFGVAQGVDYIAVSFVRRAEDLLQVRRLIKERQADIPVIAKIEKPEAVQNLDAILQACDGVMVARGDLGVEMSPEKVPILQKQIIEAANCRGALVITATQMLESMVNNPYPTRAEASDVANAILDGTDAVMLSGETSVGRFPLEAVRMMGRIAQEAEASGRGCTAADHVRRAYPQAIAHAACTIAGDLELKAICAFTQSGYTARLVSKERPKVPILAFTHDPRVYNLAALYWGVSPLLVDFVGDSDALLRCVENELLARHLATDGDSVAVLGGMPIAVKGATNFLKIQRITQ
ncbi:MAG: pyruvate kinase [Acidobacteriia bacterium]|nr:pyruvate kinase [Terriglobia bacterium]